MRDFDDWTLVYEVRPGKWIERKFETMAELNAFSQKRADEFRERMEALRRSCQPLHPQKQ